MPHPIPPRHPLAHRGPEWLFAARENALSRAEYVALLRSIADALEESGELEIGGTMLDVPETFELDLRVERAPHGARVLMIRAEWPEQPAAGPAMASARDLRIRPARAKQPTGGVA